MEELRALVIAAQGGDQEAFGRIVVRFQDMAYAVEYAMLSDSGLAQDAAQEAFIDAYLSVPKLREPAAFPGWFRRILIKHGDRQLRGKHLPTVPIEVGNSAAATTLDPATLIADVQIRRAVHDAIAALPESQRLVTTLFYVKGYSLKEIAEFLELSITGIKKHLYTARQRLKQRMIAMVQEHLQESKPSQTDHFSNKVRFFLALKTRDMRQVKTLVEKDPDLIHAQTERGVASEAYYLPLGSTALHWASATGDEPLLTFLLSRGADVNVKDPWGMTPLHLAVLMRQPAMVRLLLAHGADIDAASATGFTPLHHAVLGNSPEIAEVLLTNGANVHAVDTRQWAPVDWAAIKGRPQLIELLVAHGAKKPTPAPSTPSVAPELHERVRRVPVGKHVLGRVLDGTGKPIDGLPRLTAASKRPIYRPATSAKRLILETGIKIIDLLAPLKRGGRNGVFTPLPGVGKYVVLSQLIYHMATIYDGYAIFIGLEEEAYAANNLMLLWRGWDADRTTVHVFGHGDDAASTRLQIAETGLTIAEDFRSQGHDVLLLVDSRLALADGVLPYLKDNTLSTAEAAITTVYYGDYTVGAEPPPLADLDAVLTFDQARAKQGLGPPSTRCALTLASYRRI